jgi:hypothetical protein
MRVGGGGGNGGEAMERACGGSTPFSGQTEKTRPEKRSKWDQKREGRAEKNSGKCIWI